MARHDARLQWTVFLGCAVIVASRMPEVLLAPRLWAEESHFFSYAFSHNIIDGFTYIFWELGYCNFISNLSAVASVRILPLDLAPLGMTYPAFLAQLLPCWILLRAEGPLFSGWPRKGVCLLLLLFPPSVPSNIWINTINSQIYLGLAALILVVDQSTSQSRLGRWSTRAILALGGLTGAYVVFLQPVFLYRAIVTRCKERWIQAAIVTVALIVQLGVTSVAQSSGKMNEKRPFALSIRIVEDISHWHVAVPILGKPTAKQLKEKLGVPGKYLAFLLLMASLPWMLYDRKAKTWRLSDQRTLLILAYGAVVAGIAMTAFHGRIGGRYAIVPGFAIMLLILANVRAERPRWLSIALCLALCPGILSGVTHYWGGKAANLRPNYSWSAEVQKWRANPDYELAIQPKKWKLSLRLTDPASDS